MTINRFQNKSTLVATPYILERSGELKGLTKSEIIRRLGLPNRCRYNRAMTDVNVLRVLVPELLQAWTAAREASEVWQLTKSDTQTLTGSPPGSPDKILTIAEVAEYLKMSGTKIYTMVQRHELPFISIGRNVRIRQSDLEKWLHDRTEWPRE